MSSTCLQPEGFGLGGLGWTGLPILGGKVLKICVRMLPFYTTHPTFSSCFDCAAKTLCQKEFGSRLFSKERENYLLTPSKKFSLVLFWF